jgi:DMSO/TMAO reductase YedYZ molybdopterin-dependent catalytic subunit
MNDSLPPGQRARADFPRFGLTPFAFRFPKDATRCSLAVSGDVLESRELHEPLAGLTRVERTTDFHCVTTWTRRNLRWSGVRFADFYHSQVEPLVRRPAQPNLVVLRGQDGYRTTLPLADLLAEDVLLADRLEGEPLSIEHGAPLRLIAPSHYGYKSVKHLSRLEIWQGAPGVRPAAFAFMDHPRARVAEEERGRWLPGWLLRYVYRPLIGFTASRFAKAMATCQAQLPDGEP